MIQILWAYCIVIVAFVVNFFISVIPFYVLCIFGLKKIAYKWFYLHNRLISGFIFNIVGLHVTVTKTKAAEELLKSKQSVCFVSNHTSMLDIPAVVYSTGAHTGFVAKSVVKYIPIVNLLAYAMKCVFIDRSNKKDSVNGVRRGVKILESGHSMLIFPEGTRSKTGEIAPFKLGSFRLAMEAKVNVVPITIKGFRQAVEDRKGIFGESCFAYVHIGDPVKFSIDEDRDTRFEKAKMVEENIRKAYASLGDK